MLTSCYDHALLSVCGHVAPYRSTMGCQCLPSSACRGPRSSWLQLQRRGAAMAARCRLQQHGPWPQHGRLSAVDGGAGEAAQQPDPPPSSPAPAEPWGPRPVSSTPAAAVGQPPWLQKPGTRRPTEDTLELQDGGSARGLPELLKDAAMMAAALLGVSLVTARACSACRASSSNMGGSRNTDQVCTQTVAHSTDKQQRSLKNTTAAAHASLRQGGSLQLAPDAAQAAAAAAVAAAAGKEEEFGHHSSSLRCVSVPGPQENSSSSSRGGAGMKQRHGHVAGVLPLAAVSYGGEPENPLVAAWVAVQEWTLGRMAYSLQQLSAKGVGVRILVLMVAALPLILVFGFLYHQASGLGLKESLYKVYALLYRVPGIGLAKENNLESYMVANVVFFMGLFTFAVFLGIVSDDIKLSIKNARNGNYPVRTQGHVLLLNWNGQSSAIIRQFAAASNADSLVGRRGWWPWSRPAPVVILSDRKKADMDDIIYEVLRDRGSDLEVHTRHGNPYKLSDLRKVAALHASTVILLHPEGTGTAASAEAIKASAAMCLTALGRNPHQRVVVQMPGEVPVGGDVLASLASTAQVTGRDFQVLQLPDQKLMHRLVAQTAGQPGILTCWLDILALAATSAQFRCVPPPAELVGKSFMEVRRAYLHAVVCGYLTPRKEVHLNPSETEVLEPGSKLILLGKGVVLKRRPVVNNKVYSEAAKAAAERLQKERTYRSKPKQILVAGWPEALVPELMDGFSAFTSQGSTITFILNNEAPEEWPSRLRSTKFNFIQAKHPTSVKTLLDAGIKSADTVVIGEGAPGATDMESDARVLAALLQVQDAILASKRRTAPHVVAPIRRFATSKLASQYLDTLLREQASEEPSSTAAGASTAAAGAASQGASSAAAAGAAAAGSQPSAGGASGGSGNCSSGSNGSSSSSSSNGSGAGGVGNGSNGSSLAAGIIRMPEFLVPNDVISAVITQVAAEPAYAKVMNELLFTHEGQELYLRNPASFNIPVGMPISFAEVAETVRLTRQTAVGYVRGSGSSSTRGTFSAYKADAAGGGAAAVLGPHALHEIVFEENDRILCLAEEY